MKSIIVIIIFLLIIALGIAIGSQNNSVVEVNYLIAKSELSLSLVLAISFGLGFFIAWCFCGLLYFKVLFSRRLLKRKVNKLVKEVDKKDKDIQKLSRKSQLDADFLLTKKQNTERLNSSL
ncbi:LapA family protein [Thorsellia anophelis]|uniref:Lipopolysaccharide assembly protein A n=1 Tax=Thorsellia anophelis DSM 18579 TaxID=1123402 RepID=A0A1I0BYM7_9GAMM|nr:LapA family protein [Thorsellia anophelis]SET12170.1 putative membrane protein [Thorsellia anophelis DSM 18579]